MINMHATNVDCCCRCPNGIVSEATVFLEGEVTLQSSSCVVMC